MESQDFIRLMRMEAVDYCGRYNRMIAADHFHLHITAMHIVALQDLRLFDQFIIQEENDSIWILINT